MRPRSKTDLRRSRLVPHPPQPASPTATGAAEEALLFGETQRTIVAPPSQEWEKKERIDQSRDVA